MSTINDTMFSLLSAVQAPDVHTFIKDGRRRFDYTTADFYTSVYDLMIRSDEPPYNEPCILADEYLELGIWTPINNVNTPHKAIMLAWVDDSEVSEKSFQFVYLTPNNHLIMGREIFKYNNIKDIPIIELCMGNIY